jgi:tetratricopeptide (TPR) repeat protein
VVSLASAFWGQHRSSVQRGNRFYREGEFEGAAEVYRSRLDAQPARAALAYNLGTALMALGSPEAEEYLRVASEAQDSAVAQRGSYNLAHLFLVRAGDAEAPEVAAQLLAIAVRSGRLALRRDPRDEEARWNVYLAQHLLDSLSREVELLEGGAEERATDRSEGGLAIPEPAQRGTPHGTEREALAGDDPGSLSAAEALALLDVVTTDVEALIRGLMWSLRPDVDPWSEPYPGGEW